MKTRIIILALVCLALSGCVATKVKAPDGVELNRVALGLKTEISEISYDPVTKKFVMKGYKNDQAQIAEAVANAVAASLAPAK